MALYWQQNDPIAFESYCTRSQAEGLVAFDHHRVIVRERWGILITHHWPPLAEAAEPLKVQVILNPAPNHAPSEGQVRQVVKKHPEAPVKIQQIIDQLAFYESIV